MENYKLNNGIEIPVLGLGTFGNDNNKLKSVLKSASEIGYTLIDTSPAYGNEKYIAKALWKNFGFYIIKNFDQKPLTVS